MSEKLGSPYHRLTRVLSVMACSQQSWCIPPFAKEKPPLKGAASYSYPALLLLLEVNFLIAHQRAARSGHGHKTVAVNNSRARRSTTSPATRHWVPGEGPQN
jgi:hypothetical protein